jgi:hypothetical protein
MEVIGARDIMVREAAVQGDELTLSARALDREGCGGGL